MKFKKVENFTPKTVILVNKKCLAGKTSVGNHLHRAEGGTCAKFQPNRTASLRDRSQVSRYHRLEDPKPRKRVRDPPHTRNIPHCVKIHRHLAATALTHILVRVVEGHASACPRTGGVDKYGGVDIK